MKNSEQRKLKILLAIKEPIGDKLNAMGIRYFEFARFLGAKYETTLIAPHSGGNTGNFNFNYVPYSLINCARSTYDADLLIVTNPHPLLLLVARLLKKKVILDLYDPTLIEKLERIDFLPSKEKLSLYSIFVSWTRLQISHSDYYMCASERQRDLWLGILVLLGKLNPKSYSSDRDAKNLISIVPTGVPDKPPVKSMNVLRKVLPGVKSTDKILLWVGVPNSCYDEKLLIYAMQYISKMRSDVKLVFICGSPENSEVLRENMQLSSSLNLTGNTVYFVEQWVPYDRVADYYLEADLGVSLHHQHLETHFSMRNRVLGYLWGNLPVIVTDGDSLAELVKKNNLGIVVKEKNREELISAILELVDDKVRYEQCKTAVREVMPSYRWSRILPELGRSIEFLARTKPETRFGDLFKLLCSLTILTSKYFYYIVRYGPTRDRMGRGRLVLR